jgi:hypothetical protein
VKQAWTGESRVKDGTHYLKLEKMEGATAADAGIVGRWVSSTRSFLGTILMPEAQVWVPEPAKVVDMKNGVSNVDLFEVIDVQKADKIDGKKMHRLSVKLNTQAVAALMLKWHELKTGLVAQPEDAVAAIKQATDFGEPVGTVWIGTSDKRFRRIVLMTDAEGPDGLRADLTIDFTRYGVEVKVEAPEAEPAAALIEEDDSGAGLGLSGERSATSSAAATQPSATDDKAKDADGDGLSDSDEYRYNSDPWNPDTDADGYSDGVEIRNGKNPTGPGALFDFGLGG